MKTSASARFRLRPRPGVLLVLCHLPLLLLACGAEEGWQARRLRMVEQQLLARDIADPHVLQVMREVPRHRFVPPRWQAWAYSDSPLPIGYEQTISQPYIVAFMTQALDLQPTHRVFELGTGSGYQAAVASRMAAQVYTVEIVPELAVRASALLDTLGYENVHVRAGDGWKGWPEAAPFDRILVTAAAPELPEALLEQLAPGGRLILPLGPEGGAQRLVLVEKTAEGELIRRALLDVRFVPVTGDH